VFGTSTCWPNGVDATLSVSGARNAYNHNSARPWYPRGRPRQRRQLDLVGTAAFLPGRQDGVVAYHSAYGCADSGSQPSTCRKYDGHVEDIWCGECSAAECSGIDHFSINETGVACF